MRSHQVGDSAMIDLAVPHTLAFAFCPHWLMTLKRCFPRTEAG
jgi:hypothetical protein